MSLFSLSRNPSSRNTVSRSTLSRNLLLSASVAAALFLPGAAQAADTPERADVPAEYKWDLSAMYSSTTAWESPASS